MLALVLVHVDHVLLYQIKAANTLDNGDKLYEKRDGMAIGIAVADVCLDTILSMRSKVPVLQAGHSVMKSTMIALWEVRFYTSSRSTGYCDHPSSMTISTRNHLTLYVCHA